MCILVIEEHNPTDRATFFSTKCDCIQNHVLLFAEKQLRTFSVGFGNA